MQLVSTSQVKTARKSLENPVDTALLRQHANWLKCELKKAESAYKEVMDVQMEEDHQRDLAFQFEEIKIDHSQILEEISGALKEDNQSAFWARSTKTSH